MPAFDDPSTVAMPRRWHQGITGYQWLVLAIASAGWAFDVYEGQIFGVTRKALLSEVLPADASIAYWGDVLLGVFLVGGTLGGLVFGSLADRWGRRPTMVLTILFYSVFSGLTYFATSLWEVAVLRFLVAIGVGGEWAVAAALVAEVFPKHARAQASAIFHATSVLGTWMAAIVAIAVGAHWRYAYLVGVAPALLILWVRSSVKEPESWSSAVKADPNRMGSYRELLLTPEWRRRALLGMLLATIGLGTFWAVTLEGQGLAVRILKSAGASEIQADQAGKFAYGIVETAGGGVGLLAFGPLCARIGRRPAFALMQIMAAFIVPITCFLPSTYAQLLWLLPVYGFFTLGIHSGYAVYFPELFPTHLRATGTSFCFNCGRILAAGILVLSGMVKSMEGMDLRWAVSGFGMLFLVGAAIVYWMPETRGKDLIDS